MRLLVVVGLKSLALVILVSNRVAGLRREGGGGGSMPLKSLALVMKYLT